MNGKRITIEQKEKIITIMRNHYVVIGYLFGSYARGTAGLLSDIDVGVVFPTDMKQNLQEDYVEDIRSELERMFGRDKADVVNVSLLKSPLLRYIITLGQGIVLFSDHSTLENNLVKYARREYEDTRSLRYIQYQTLQKLFA